MLDASKQEVSPITSHVTLRMLYEAQEEARAERETLRVLMVGTTDAVLWLAKDGDTVLEGGRLFQDLLRTRGGRAPEPNLLAQPKLQDFLSEAEGRRLRRALFPEAPWASVSRSGSSATPHLSGEEDSRGQEDPRYSR